MVSSDKNKNLDEIESSLKRRLDYEHATVQCMRTLLEPGSIDDILPRILKIVHMVVDNSRTYIFKNEPDPDLGLCMSQIYEAVSHGIEPQIDNPELQHLSYNEATPTLLTVLESRRHFAHFVEELDEPEKTLLSEQGIISILIIPIYAGKNFWGFIGFDDCVKTREWDENDIDLLKMVADGIGEFISHRKAEKELRESEERYRALHNATFGGILIHDKGRILDCNQGLSDMTGYSKKELLANDSFKIITEESKPIVREKLAVGSEEPYEIMGLRKDGTEYPMRVQAKNIPYKGKKVRVTELRDITEQKESENELRESEERFKALHEGSFGGIFVHFDDIIVECNQGLSEITGYSQDELIGKKGLTLIAKRCRTKVLNIVASGYEDPYEAIGIRKDGTEYPLKVQAKNIPYKGKRARVVEFRDITEHKKTENELRESEERFKALHNASFGGIFIHMDGTIIDCNLGLSEMTGYLHDDLIGMDGLLLIAEKYRDKVIDNMKSSHEDSFEAVGLRKDGTEYPIFTQSKNIPYKGRNVRVVEFRDITEQKKTENELRESEQRFKALHNASFGGITIHDKGLILDCNLGLSEITGYSFDELIGMNGLLLIAENSRELVMGNILAGYEEPYEAIGLRKNGTEYPVRLEARNIPYKGKMVRVVEFRDITERKESEKALRDSERKFRSYLESAPYGIFILDEHGNYLEVNKTACKLTGYDENELTHMNISDLIAPESLISAGQSFDELKTSGYTFAELQFKHKDGSISWISRNGAKLSDNRFILFISDITEKKKAENSLIEAKILAEHNNRIKSEFLANMSHELRTPLTAVIGFSDILQEGIAGELEEKQLGYVEHINNSGRHLLGIINDILDLSKIEAGKMELDCEDFYVSETIDETLKSMNLIARKKNIILNLTNNINNEIIFADKVKFQQILYNLLSNAIKFTPEDGKVFINLEKADNGIQVSVTDTGIGISAERQEEIFSPFTQVDASSKRRYGGTGLGLALVKKFVEMHNGKVWLESEEGEGSTFTFTIEDQKKNE
jgi:PAS domain S-box-containing protein